MMRKRVLLIHFGPFSGIKDNIFRALERQGCQVVQVKHTLRELKLRPLFAAIMWSWAILRHGARARLRVNQTRVAGWVHHLVNRAIVERHPDMDAVLELNLIYRTHGGRKHPGTKYAILTDHINLLSKQLPDYGIEFPERGAPAVWNQLEAQALAEQDFIFVLGDFVRQGIIDHYGIDARQVITVGAGPNLPVDAEGEGIRKDYTGQNILFVGLDGARKGLPVLESAFAQIAGRFPDAHLHVAGAEGQSSERITYYGRVTGEPLKALFYNAQIFAMPSLREPFGIVFVEAMWAKNVCIGTDLCAMPEIIDDGETGFVVEPNDPAALADRLSVLLADPATVERMAEAGYGKARQRYSWDQAMAVVTQTLFPNPSERAGHPESEPLPQPLES